jgi:hypothetical protein
LLKF